MRALVRRLADWPARRRGRSAGPGAEGGFYDLRHAHSAPPRAEGLRRKGGGSGTAQRTLDPSVAHRPADFPDLRPDHGGTGARIVPDPLLPLDAARRRCRADRRARRRPSRRASSPVPIFVASLKEPTSVAFVEEAHRRLEPAAIITATAFASGAEPGVETLFDRAGVPVFQVIVATTRREAWAQSHAAWPQPTSPCMS